MDVISEDRLKFHLHEFRRKFYLNQVIRGSVLLSLAMGSILLISIVGEGFLAFSAFTRSVIFSLLSLGFLSTLAWMVLVPVSRLMNLSRGISEMDMAKMIRTHFPEVDDKLINLLQLRGGTQSENELAVAAIRKKTELISPVRFAVAIDLKLNWRIARYLAIPLFIFAIIYYVNPDVLMGGTYRLMNFTREFPKPMPFEILIRNHPLQMVSGEAHELDVEVEGREFPAELYIHIRKSPDSEFVSYEMKKSSVGQFGFVLSEMKEKFAYFIGNEEVVTDEMSVRVLRRPSIRDFLIAIDYPDYTGLATDTLPRNIGDVNTLKGSGITWILEASSGLKEAAFVGKGRSIFRSADGKLLHQQQAMESEEYYFSLSSLEGIRNEDTVKYRIDILDDRHPSIFLNVPDHHFDADHTLLMPVEFEISDDYGFGGLSLYYRFPDEAANAGSGEFTEIKIGYLPRTLVQQKSLQIDLMNLGLSEGGRMEFFVKVWDNDAISGPKFAVSTIVTASYKSLNEKYELVEESQEKMESNLDEMLKEMEKIKEGYEKMQEKLLDSKNFNYDDKKQFKNLIEKQSSVREQMKELQKQFQENKENLENNQMFSEETQKKYDQLNEYLKALEDEKLQKMLEKLKSELDEMSAEELKKELEKLQEDEEEMNKALERTMELLKQLEIEQKIEELINKIDNLKEKQDLLNEKLEDTDSKEEQQNLAGKQEELKKEMEDIKKDLADLKEMKETTKSPDEEEMEELMQDAGDASESMENAKGEMQKGSKASGSSSQQNASKKMEEMMQGLSGMQMANMQKKDEQNMENLREIIENLIGLSFDQEELRDEVKNLKQTDPQVASKDRLQKQLQDDMEMVRDSLEELAKEVFQIEKFILDESKAVMDAMKEARELLDQKRANEAARQQHISMTSINNLANMLSDVLSQLQLQMMSNKEGNGSCKKPGMGKPGMMGMGQQQKELNAAMKKLFEKLNAKSGDGNGKNGEKPEGENKNGEGGAEDGEAGLAKRLSELAEKQKELREQLGDMKGDLEKEGGKTLGDLGKIMEDMKMTEDQLKNKQLTQETLRRQQQILDRLLDANKSVREKNEFENQRESNSGKERSKTPPDQLTIEEYENMIRQELLKSNQLEFSNDFLILIEKYYKLLGERQIRQYNRTQ